MSVSLLEIQISNFKSFNGLWKIGPLKSCSFNAIIGPNGVGKSNIIDAIAFSFGEKSANLRVSKIVDLVNKLEDIENCDTYVAVKFQLENRDTKTFKRSITQNSSQYQINERIITKQAYHDQLQDLYINITAKNSIIRQDDINSIFMRSPKERVTLFEKISHSIDFKEEYDYLKDKMSELYNKTKQFQDEKRMLASYHRKLICAETERKNQLALQKDYEKAMSELTLFNLYVIELRNKKFNDDLASMKIKLERLEEQIEKIKESLQAKKEEVLGLTTAASVVEDKINNAQKILDEIAPDRLENEEKIVKCEKRLIKAKKLLAIAIKVDESRERQIAELEENLKEVLEAKEQFTQSLSQQFEETFGKIVEWDREYDELRLQVVKQTKGFYPELYSLEREKQQLIDNIENEKRIKNEINHNLMRKQNFYVDIEIRTCTMQNHIQETEDKIRDKRKVYSELSETIEALEKKRRDLEIEFESIRDQLMDCEFSKVQQDKIKQENYMVETLRRSFPEVHDRLYKLIHPIHSHYKIAFTKIFAPYFAHIVVDTTETAIKCIEYLKLHKIGRATFLPLDGNLEVVKLKEQLRSFEQHEGVKNVKLLYDLITFSSVFDRVVLHVAKNILVCGTSEIAEDVAYNSPSGERYDCVALDGTFYKKSGLFSGGKATLEEKSKLLNATKKEEIQTKRVELRSALKKIYCNMDSADLKILEMEIKALEKKLKYYNNIFENIKKESENLELEMKELNNDLQEVEKTISNIDKKINKSNEKIEAVQTKINQVEDEVFADFCLKIDIPNIREYEESQKIYKEMKLKKLEYEDQYERIKNLLVYEKARNTKRDVEKLETNINNLHQIISEQRSKRLDLDTEYNKQNTLLNKCKETLTVTRCEIKRLDDEITQDEESLEQLLKYRATLNGKPFGIKIMNNLQQRHNLLIEAKIHNITLPFLEDTSLDILPELYPSNEEDLSIQQIIELYERENVFKLDYTYLTEKPESASDEIEICRMRGIYQEKLDELESSISALDATAKVSQELTTVKGKLKALEHKLSITRKLNKEIQFKFEKVKNDRYEAFMDLFETTVQNVDQIYKKMCGHHSAQALLFAENVEEPYLGGIRYDCTPPKKRHCPGNLSGGETALAALSLIFAIQNKSPSPILLFDEIDAALDQENRKNVVAYINGMENNQQIIVISQHKELFRNCDVVIGVYPTESITSQMESNIIVMDLIDYQ